MNSLMDQIVAMENRKRRAWEKELAALPKGSLYCLYTSGKTYFYHAINGERHSISRDMDLVYLLARKKYLALRLSEQRIASRRATSALGSKRKQTPRGNVHLSPLEKLLDYYGRRGLEILRITCSRDQYLWAKADYLQNPMNPEELTHETYSGIKMRTKSERSIGNGLEIRGIPYRYEQAMELDVEWMEDVRGMDYFGRKIYYPDFVILTATGEIIVWEHLGRTDLKRYREHNMEKIAAYREGGQFDDAHIVLSFEKDMNTPSTLEQLIERRITPYM